MANGEHAMRVLIDAHMVGARETGNETYIANLIRHLPQLPAVQCAAAVTRGKNADQLTPAEQAQRKRYTEAALKLIDEAIASDRKDASEPASTEEPSVDDPDNP